MAKNAFLPQKYNYKPPPQYLTIFPYMEKDEPDN